MPNSGVRRYAAALQSLVSAGARDRLARAEEPVVRRLCAGGGGIRTFGPRERTTLSETGALDVAARPIIFYAPAGNCRQPYVKGLTIMSNSIYNGWRMEDVWLDK